MYLKHQLAKHTSGMRKRCYIHDCTTETIYTFGINCKELMDLKAHLSKLQHFLKSIVSYFILLRARFTFVLVPIATFWQFYCWKIQGTSHNMHLSLATALCHMKWITVIDMSCNSILLSSPSFSSPSAMSRSKMVVSRTDKMTPEKVQ